uniref:Putative secreted protein n=1 Tax=Anopheles triannulatus TaxID=58253 RepID=A0A2M4B7U3_9DIPT
MCLGVTFSRVLPAACCCSASRCTRGATTGISAFGGHPIPYNLHHSHRGGQGEGGYNKSVVRSIERPP